jgi:hypothetical protein
MIIVYDDGTPRTKHVTTNIAIEVDEEADTSGRCSPAAGLRCHDG